ncbi:MAG: hypothetical protein ICV55_15450 [Coleofasciculus sp. C3-bin4]|nr:hypothetical protein [Coleofasciculus sp. C3-bin4]
MMIIPISSVKKAPAEGIPHIALERSPKQVQLNRPEASIASEPAPAMPPTTLPPAIFPTNQTPTIRVPSLRSIPAPTPTPVTTSQPLERPAERVSPAPTSPPVIEFGQPLPKTTR